MTHQPVTPTAHGLIDYGFGAIQLAAPSALGLNAPTKKAYQLLGIGFLAVNAFTDTPVGIKPVLSFQQHQTMDATFLVAYPC